MQPGAVGREKRNLVEWVNAASTVLDLMRYKITIIQRIIINSITFVRLATPSRCGPYGRGYRAVVRCCLRPTVERRWKVLTTLL